MVRPSSTNDSTIDHGPLVRALTAYRPGRGDGTALTQARAATFTAQWPLLSGLPISWAPSLLSLSFSRSVLCLIFLDPNAPVVFLTILCFTMDHGRRTSHRRESDAV